MKTRFLHLLCCTFFKSLCTSKAHPKRPDHKAIRFYRELYRPLIIHCISMLKCILSEKERRCFCDNCFFIFNIYQIIQWLKKHQDKMGPQEVIFCFTLREVTLLIHTKRIILYHTNKLLSNHILGTSSDRDCIVFPHLFIPLLCHFCC